MSERKCVVCYKPFQTIKSRASRRGKVGRTSNAKYTCSPPCARIYNALLNHFKYKLKKDLEIKRTPKSSKKYKGGK